MAHLRTKTTHKFTCDICGLAAGEHAYEAEALAMARSVADLAPDTLRAIRRIADDAIKLATA